MTDLLVRFSARGPLHGVAHVPGDKSISHRVLLMAALSDGTSTVRGLSDGDDVVRTRLAVAALGAKVSAFDEGFAITGGRDNLREPERPIDLGNSGTGIRLLSGVVASLPFLSVLIGDASIHRRPMDRIVTPLRMMGAVIDARSNGSLAPLCIRGGDLEGIDYTTPVPSAQVKSAILFAGLAARGETVVRQSVASRIHTEELFIQAGRPVELGYDDLGQHRVALFPGSLAAGDYDVPGDPSQAAFLAVAASIVAGSDVTIENVYVGQGRAEFLDVLKRMGADISCSYRSESSADITVRSAELHGTEVGGAEVVGLIDEIPVLAVAAAFASGTTTFSDAGELRVKESDRIASTAAGLRALGVTVEEFPDGFSVTGGSVHDAPSVIEAALDHRIAMSFAIGALARGEIAIDGFGAVETSWPGFRATLDALSWS